MEKYDVVVVGAGPAGGQCARELAHTGKKVLLIDKAKSFQENNFSSGGAPIEMMHEFDLPSSIVGSYWEKLVVASTHEKVEWRFPRSFGPILDFDKFRDFLAEDAVKQGAKFVLGCNYISHQINSSGVKVQLRDHQMDHEYEVQTKVLVDATGTDRKVISEEPYNKEIAMAATGIEYHIQVNPAVYERFANSMSFFLGHKWMPQGYAWIFSMAPYQLKVGVVRYFQNKQYVPHNPSYRPYLEQVLSLCGSPESYEIKDKHGKTICYTLGQKDKKYEGPVIAIGDAISTLNPMGCEGIRHALVSGRLAAKEINQFLNKRVCDFKRYDRSLRQYFGRKWFFSELMMKNLFKNKKDYLIDRIIKSFSLMNNQEIIDVIFNYRFSRTLKSYFWYFSSRLKDGILTLANRHDRSS